MGYLKLHRDEPEQPEPPAPIPFRSPDRTWREAGGEQHGGAEMDSVTRVEQALSRVEEKFSDLTTQVDELCEPIQLSRWIDDDDDGPWAA